MCRLLRTLINYFMNVIIITVNYNEYKCIPSIVNTNTLIVDVVLS